MTVKNQGLPGTGKIFTANTIRNIDINLNPLLLSYTCCAPTGGAISLIMEPLTINYSIFL